jgi:YD repeat-containing protein
VTDNSWWEYPAASASTVALNHTRRSGPSRPRMMATATSRPTAPSPYGYDAENRLVSATGPGITASYAYDAQGSRKSKTVNGATTMFVTDADNREVLEYDGSTGAVQRWYAYGLGSNDVLNQMNVSANTRATFIPDIQGSIIAALDSSTGAHQDRLSALWHERLDRRHLPLHRPAHRCRDRRAALLPRSDVLASDGALPAG